jgi:hypothetical protein
MRASVVTEVDGTGNQAIRHNHSTSREVVAGTESDQVEHNLR